MDPFGKKDPKKMEGWKRIVHTSSTQKRAGVSILTSEKDFKSKIFIRDKEALYIFIQMSIYQEDKTTVNIAKT